jgi:hypothetical protein
MRFVLSIGRMILIHVSLFEIQDPEPEMEPDVIVVHHHEEEDDGPGDLFGGGK